MSAAGGWIMLEAWRAAALAVMLGSAGYIIGRMGAWYMRRKDGEDLIEALDGDQEEQIWLREVAEAAALMCDAETPVDERNAASELRRLVAERNAIQKDGEKKGAAGNE